MESTADHFINIFKINQDYDRGTREKIYNLNNDEADKLNNWLTINHNNNKNALMVVAWIYDNNNDYDNAIIWYRKAIEYKMPGAMSNLAYLLKKINSEVNREEVIKLYEQACEFDLPDSFYNLACMYVKSDKIKALEYFSVSYHLYNDENNKRRCEDAIGVHIGNKVCMMKYFYESYMNKKELEKLKNDIEYVFVEK